VFPREPQSNDEPFESPLRGLDNVILTPHVAGSTIEAQTSIGVEVAEKLIKYSNNGSTLTAVNFPEVALPEHRGKHRILHIHRNQPGVLARINGILGDSKVNVSSEYLETTRSIGYAVIDVDGADRPLSLALRKELDAIEGTIRTRILY
jgi:D-3-phosphoglycerate dehydrogenase / 2-oxoglutarate reductase